MLIFQIILKLAKQNKNKTEINTSGEIVIPDNLKIIIAEDDKTSFTVLNYMMKEITDNILHAETGLEAVQLIKTIRIQILF